MIKSAPLKAGAAFLMLLTLIGCGNSDRAPAIINTTPMLPPRPADCRGDTPHADVRPGDDALSVLARERVQLNTANAKADACGAFYDRLRREG